MTTSFADSVKVDRKAHAECVFHSLTPNYSLRSEHNAMNQDLLWKIFLCWSCSFHQPQLTRRTGLNPHSETALRTRPIHPSSPDLLCFPPLTFALIFEIPCWSPFLMVMNTDNHCGWKWLTVYIRSDLWGSFSSWEFWVVLSIPPGTI